MTRWLTAKVASCSPSKVRQIIVNGDLQAGEPARHFSRVMRPRRRRRVARGEAEPRSGRKRPRDSARRRAFVCQPGGLGWTGRQADVPAQKTAFFSGYEKSGISVSATSLLATDTPRLALTCVYRPFTNPLPCILQPHRDSSHTPYCVINPLILRHKSLHTVS